MKPRIGITTLFDHKPKKVHSSVSYNYIKSVQMAGGLPILIPITNDKEDINEYIDNIDGIIFTGGEDIDPLFYGAEPFRSINYTSPERDEYEKELYLKALDYDIPILGICRGLQLINVASGGTLYQDINQELINSHGHCPTDNPVHHLYHSINIKEDSLLYKIFSNQKIKVNSFHHQAIKTLGRDFKISAYANDNVVEAIERIDKRFVVGIQWHAEDLTSYYPEFIKLFEALVEEASRGRIQISYSI
jgi:putative glutamine amidotransferase